MLPAQKRKIPKTMKNTRSMYKEILARKAMCGTSIPRMQNPTHQSRLPELAEIRIYKLNKLGQRAY